MIGRSAGESELFDVAAGASVPLVLRLEARAILLEGVEVTAAAGPCETRPRVEGRLMASVVGREAFTVLEATDGFGVCRSCSVPRREELTIWVNVDGIEGPPRTLTITAEDEAHTDVIRYGR